MADENRRPLIDPILVDRFQDMTDALMTIKRHELDPTIEHSIDGIVTEAGELADAAKRVKWYGTKIDTVNVLEECGDMLFYLDKLIRACDSNFNDVIEMNMKKLAKRYKGHKFTEDQAVHRDTDKERVVLEDTKGYCYACAHKDTCKHDAKGFVTDCADKAIQYDRSLKIRPNRGKCTVCFGHPKMSPTCDHCKGTAIEPSGK